LECHKLIFNLHKGCKLYVSEAEASQYWDNYLILPVNTPCITQLIQSKSEENLLDLRYNLSPLFVACLDKLSLTEEQAAQHGEAARQDHAIALLTVLIRNLFSKKRLTHFNIISLLTGLDEADVLFTKLVRAIQRLVLQPSKRSSVLQLALVLSAGSDNVNQNGLNGYFMDNDLSATLFQVSLWFGLMA
jgi:hypothetical protein